MMGASLNRCKEMEDQAEDSLKQLAAKLELVLLNTVVNEPLPKEKIFPKVTFLVYDSMFVNSYCST